MVADDLTPRLRRRGLHGEVVEAIGRRIVAGELPPGTIVDMQQLEKELGVSHTVMRESFKVLSAKQLINARPKVGTYVLPRRYWNLLDADVTRWRPDKHKLLQDLSEVRAIVEPNYAALAAERADAAQIAEMKRALDDLRTAVGRATHDPAAGWDAAVDADVAFHIGICEATGNELAARFESMLLPAVRTRHLETLPRHHAQRFLDEHAEVLRAIEAGNPDSAREAMTLLLRNAAEDTA